MTGYFHRWSSFFFGRQNCERFVPGEGHKTSFRSHLVWAKRRNVNLKELITQKCLKNTTVVALIVNTDIAILYNPSELADSIRNGLKSGDVRTLQFWTGLSTSISLCFAVFALISNYTAYSIFNSLSPQNAPIVLRSSIGRYASDLPNNLVNYSIKALFVTAIFTFLEIAKPGPPAIIVVVLWALVFMNVIVSSLSLSHTIIHTGAMGCDPILSEEEEEKLTPDELSDHLLQKVLLARKAKVPANYQYQVPYQHILKEVERGHIVEPMSEERLNDLRDSRFTRRWFRH